MTCRMCTSRIDESVILDALSVAHLTWSPAEVEAYHQAWALIETLTPVTSIAPLEGRVGSQEHSDA